MQPEAGLTRAMALFLGLAIGTAPTGASAAPAPPATPLRITVDLSPAGTLGTFRPDRALGAGVDGAQKGDLDRLFTARNITAMRSLGLKSLTYRLRTELGIEAWHWTEEGAWSDPTKAQGYWTSSDAPQKPIQLSWGYNLPRRGDTDDNANNASYSRLTDGDPQSFWKSNPYLDPVFTHEKTGRPQWLEVRLDTSAPIDAARIAWAEPYARVYEVQYWTGKDDYDSTGHWKTFPRGAVTGASGGDALLRLADAPLTVRYLRVLMEASSGTAPADSTDLRDRLGYAVREIGFGRIGPDGAFNDVVRHAPAHLGQTFTHASSTDPWHRATDRDIDLEQVGVDRIFDSGLGSGLPVMMPIGVAYDTPDNAAALIRYLTRRGYPVDQVEMGEEPDGQYGDPADYGALYLEFLDRLRPINPHIAYGGPSLQSAATDLPLVEVADRSWNRGFIRYLQSRDRLSALQFFSFEHYPFDDTCGDLNAKLLTETRLLDDMLRRVRDEGVPKTIPWVISEYGFSAFSGQAMLEPQAALLQADIVGHFLSAGGSAAYMFGYGPNTPFNQHLACAGYGTMAPFLADPEGQAGQTLPSFHLSRLLTGAWLVPGDGLHRLRRAKVEAPDPRGRAPKDGLVVAYAVSRPDGRLATLIINRSADQAFAVTLSTRSATARPLSGRLDVYQYGAEQYRWRPDGVNGHPSLNLAPTRWRAAAQAGVRLPANSVTVVVGRPTGGRPAAPPKHPRG